LRTKVIGCTLAAAVTWLFSPCVADDAARLLERGIALRVEGKSREAAETLLEALSRAKGNGEVLVQLGATLEDLGKAPDAVRCYKDALAADPKNAIARRNLEQLEAARILADSQSTANPAREALLRKGLAALSSRHFHQASTCFRVSRGLLERDPRPLFYSAVNLEHQGRMKEAIARYERTVEVFPDYAPGWINLIIALVTGGDEKAAAGACQKARQAVPSDRRIQWLAKHMIADAR
jgi:tetratricopeptide (TPR) repeat protein